MRKQEKSKALRNYEEAKSGAAEESGEKQAQGKTKEHTPPEENSIAEMPIAADEAAAAAVNTTDKTTSDEAAAV